MLKPYSKSKILPKMRAEYQRLQRLAISDLPEEVIKYISAAAKKLEKAIELWRKEE